MKREHVCVDCKLDPPKTVRDAKYGGPRTRRCATHQRAHVRATRTRRADARVVKVYDLEPGEYEELLAFQGGTCAFPRCPARGVVKRLAVDHDHVTGRTRGLLCSPHNHVLLGRFANDLQAGLDYLANPPAARMRARKKAA